MFYLCKSISGDLAKHTNIFFLNKYYQCLSQVSKHAKAFLMPYTFILGENEKD
jgi:hypothetical protein